MAKRAATKRQRWTEGDVFAIPLKDGSAVLGQVVGRERDALNSVGIVLFDSRLNLHTDEPSPDAIAADKVFSVVLSTPDLLNSGTWLVVANRPIVIPVEKTPYEKYRSVNWVGARIYGSAIVGEFANAFYGLCAWDDWKDPNYLDELLISPTKKDRKLLLKNEISKH